MTRGTHQFGLGGYGAYWDFNIHGNVFSAGSFTVTGSHTGSALADFLIGRMSTFEQATPNLNPTKHEYVALYMTDSWKVNQRWTLNYGLRWEPDLPDILKFGTVQNFSEERRAAGIHTTVYKNAPNGFYYPGDPGYPGNRGREINWLVLAPLPVRPRTLFLAKVAALATALSLTVAALNACSGLIWPVHFIPPGAGLFG